MMNKEDKAPDKNVIYLTIATSRQHQDMSGWLSG